MKKIQRLITLFIIIIMCSSCAKDETIMTINKDKSLNIEVNLGYPVGSTPLFDISELKNKAGLLGYSIDSYHDDKFSGYKLSKKISNINDVSTNENIKLNLADIVTGNIDDSKIFRIEKGFFKNTYYANFTYNFENIYDYTPKIYLFGSDLNQNTIEISNYINEYITSKEYDLDVIKYDVLGNLDNFTMMTNILNSLDDNYAGIPVIIINNKVFTYNNETIKKDISNEIDNIFHNGIYTDVLSNDSDNSYELIYKVNLPKSSISNNATSVSNDNKTLIWNCNYFSENNIEYSFSLFNISSIIIIIIIMIIFIVTSIIGFIFYRKYKKDKEKFITKNTDISNILPQIDENNTITSINDLVAK